jgi:hypothetical protein
MKSSGADKSTESSKLASDRFVSNMLLPLLSILCMVFMVVMVGRGFLIKGVLLFFGAVAVMLSRHINEYRDNRLFEVLINLAYRVFGLLVLGIYTIDRLWVFQVMAFYLVLFGATELYDFARELSKYEVVKKKK